MKSVRLHDKTFRLSVPHDRIAGAIGSLARRLDADYAEGPVPLFVVVLNGAFMFAAQLLQEIRFDCEVAFVKLSSYEGTASSGSVSTAAFPEGICGREVIVLEDIVDTGRTVAFLACELEKHGPASVRFASLFFKPGAYRGSIPVDYYAMELPDDFVVGFGLDYDGLGRNLRDIYTLEDQTK